MKKKYKLLFGGVFFFLSALTIILLCYGYFNPFVINMQNGQKYHYNLNGFLLIIGDMNPNWKHLTVFSHYWYPQNPEFHFAYHYVKIVRWATGIGCVTCFLFCCFVATNLMIYFKKRNKNKKANFKIAKYGSK